MTHNLPDNLFPQNGGSGQLADFCRTMDISPLRALELVLRNSFAAFAERCFSELLPSTHFNPNWHLDALACYLEKVADGSINRLVITLPPRSAKSLYTSVALPAWILGHNPSKRIITASYGQALTVDLSANFRRILKSPWYQKLFPAVQIDPRKDNEHEVRTTAGGYRLTTTTGGPLTGRGGALVIIDDPLKASEANSEASRTSVNNWFNETLLSRLDDKKTDAIIIVMQRLHVDDLAGHVLKMGDWVHLDLPAIADSDSTIWLSDTKVHHRKAGDVLHPDREPRETLEKLQREMGSAAFSAQYLQRPVPVSGNIVKWDWFRRYDQLPGMNEPGVQIVQSWDTAQKASEIHDYSVCVTALVRKKEIFVLDVTRVRAEYPVLRKKIIEQAKRYKRPKILIEDKGSGISLIQDLRRDQLYATAVKPEADKVTRMYSCSNHIENGSVLLPKVAPWLDAFRSELLAFPNSAHDDQVDALSQLINWVHNRSGFTLDNIR